MGRNSGSGCCTRASASADCTTRRRLSSSCLLVVARAVPPAKTRRAPRCASLFLGHVLMDRVVGEARQRTTAAGYQQLDLVSGSSLRSLSKMEAAWSRVSIWQVAAGLVAMQRLQELDRDKRRT